MSILAFMRRKNGGPLQEKVLEITKGRLSLADVPRLMELVR